MLLIENRSHFGSLDSKKEDCCVMKTLDWSRSFLPFPAPLQPAKKGKRKKKPPPPKKNQHPKPKTKSQIRD